MMENDVISDLKLENYELIFIRKLQNKCRSANSLNLFLESFNSLNSNSLNLLNFF